MYCNLTRVKEYVATSNCTEEAFSNCTYVTSFVEKDTVDDASAGMAIVLLLFIIPKKFSREASKNGNTGGPRYSRGLRCKEMPRIAKPRIASPIMT